MLLYKLNSQQAFLTKMSANTNQSVKNSTHQRTHSKMRTPNKSTISRGPKHTPLSSLKENSRWRMEPTVPSSRPDNHSQLSHNHNNNHNNNHRSFTNERPRRNTRYQYTIPEPELVTKATAPPSTEDVTEFPSLCLHASTNTGSSNAATNTGSSNVDFTRLQWVNDTKSKNTGTELSKTNVRRGWVNYSRNIKNESCYQMDTMKLPDLVSASHNENVQGKYSWTPEELHHNASEQLNTLVNKWVHHEEEQYENNIHYESMLYNLLDEGDNISEDSSVSSANSDTSMCYGSDFEE